jgi:hypothetical protein
VTKSRKKWYLGKKLEEFGRKERESRENSSYKELDFTYYAPDPVLEDEYFGGFIRDREDRKSGEHCKARRGASPERAKVLFGLLHYERGFARYRAPIKRWAAETLWGLVDGQMPETYRWLKARDRWPEWRKIRPQRPTSNQACFPFAQQAIKQAEQELPFVNPKWDHEELIAQRERLSAFVNREFVGLLGDNPGCDPVIRHLERADFYAQHTERRVQALFLRGFKPSKKLELKRLPKLRRLASNPLLTNDFLYRGFRQTKDDRRAECALLVARFEAEGSLIQVCPPEKTAAQLNKKKMGRPPKFGRAMTPKERKRLERELKALPPQERNEPSTAVPMPLRAAVPGTYPRYEAIILEIETMITKLLDVELAERYHEYLGQVLDRLVIAPPDYIISREEFTIIAAAAVLADKLLLKPELH